MTAAADHLDLLSDLVSRARRSGAAAADAVLASGTSISAARRLGKIERLERSEAQDLGLRVFLGRRQAIVSSTDLSADARAQLVERAIAMARNVPEDPYGGLADPGLLATSIPDLDLDDPAEPSPETLVEQAARMEEAALAVPGVTNSEGAEVAWSRGEVAMVASNGFAGAHAGSRYGFSTAVIAGSGTAMERDYDFVSVRHAGDLPPPEEIGRGAGERAVRRLRPRKVATQQVPVVYDPRVSASLLRHIAGAISGAAVARGTSFLRDALGKEVFGPGITIVDDPHRRRGLASRPFDGEGVATRRRNVVEGGRLVTWLLDTRSARQLGLTTTGHAARGVASPPSPAPSNLYLEPGTLTPEELILEAGTGFYVTGMLGMGVNAVTGDYSRGAAGFWIEDGALAYPVSEVTVAGNLRDMFRHLTPANDLVFRYGINAPTLRVDGLTVAGS